VGDLAEFEANREGYGDAVLFASVLLDAGESIKALSEWLDHADPGFTMRVYTHLMPGSAERARNAIDRVLGADTGSETWKMGTHRRVTRTVWRRRETVGSGKWLVGTVLVRTNPVRDPARLQTIAST